MKSHVLFVIAGFILGISSMQISFSLSIILDIIALLIGLIAFKQIDKEKGKYEEK